MTVGQRKGIRFSRALDGVDPLLARLDLEQQAPIQLLRGWIAGEDQRDDIRLSISIGPCRKAALLRPSAGTRAPL